MSQQRSIHSFFSTNRPSSDSHSTPESESTASSTSEAETPVPTKRQRTKEYNSAWVSEFPWHRREENEGTGKIALFCTVCEEAKKVNGFTKGSSNFQRSALVDHQKSASHVSAVEAIQQKKRMVAAVRHVQEKTSSALQEQLKVVLWMAKEDIAPTKFDSVLCLMKAARCPALEKANTYSHQDAVEEMEKALVQTTTEYTDSAISQSDYIGIIIDETVNVTIDKKLIIYLRIIKDEKPKTVFLGNFTVLDGTAETIATKVREALEARRIDFDKVIGLASDGASVMTGRHNGVGVKLRRENNPFLIHIHCACHRVALASQDASKAVRKVADYKNTANSVYKFYQYSATRNQRLKELNAVLTDDDFTSLKQPCSVRWLSLQKAVDSLRQNWPAIVMELGEEATRQNNAVADGLLRTVQTFAFIAMTHMLSDILSIINRLNLIFQKDSVTISTIRPMVQSTISELEDSYLATPHSRLQNEDDFMNQITPDGQWHDVKMSHYSADAVRAHERLREEFVQHTIDSLKARFPQEDLDIIHNIDILLNSAKYPDQADALRDHGNDALDVVFHYFGNQRTTSDGHQKGPVLNSRNARQEFNQLKATLKGHGKMNFETTCGLIMRDYKDIFPEFAKLASIGLVIPVTSVPAERGFSLQNRIKTAKRSSLSENRVNRLMLLSSEALSLDQFPFAWAAEIFNGMRERRK